MVDIENKITDELENGKTITISIHGLYIHTNIYITHFTSIINLISNSDYILAIFDMYNAKISILMDSENHVTAYMFKEKNKEVYMFVDLYQAKILLKKILYMSSKCKDSKFRRIKIEDI